jgi:hypothetical protein
VVLFGQDARISRVWIWGKEQERRIGDFGDVGVGGANICGGGGGLLGFIRFTRFYLAKCDNWCAILLWIYDKRQTSPKSQYMDK